jgi:hypothetical protein
MAIVTTTLIFSTLSENLFILRRTIPGGEAWPKVSFANNTKSKPLPLLGNPTRWLWPIRWYSPFLLDCIIFSYYGC